MQTIRAVEHGFLDVILLSETKIQTEAYYHNCLGYYVKFSKASPYNSGGGQGSTGLVTRERPEGWGIESMRFHRPNVVSCKIVTGPTRTLLVSAYLIHSMLEHLPGVKEALQSFKGRNSIVLVDLNVNPDNAWSSRSQCMVDLFT